jgi:hypothetical protein
MTEQIKHPTFKDQWKAKKVVKKAKKMAIKKLVKDGMPETTARHLVKKASESYFTRSNQSVQQRQSDIE